MARLAGRVLDAGATGPRPLSKLPSEVHYVTSRRQKCKSTTFVSRPSFSLRYSESPTRASVPWRFLRTRPDAPSLSFSPTHKVYEATRTRPSTDVWRPWATFCLWLGLRGPPLSYRDWGRAPGPSRTSASGSYTVDGPTTALPSSWIPCRSQADARHPDLARRPSTRPDPGLVFTPTVPSGPARYLHGSRSPRVTRDGPLLGGAGGVGPPLPPKPSQVLWVRRPCRSRSGSVRAPHPKFPVSRPLGPRGLGSRGTGGGRRSGLPARACGDASMSRPNSPALFDKSFIYQCHVQTLINLSFIMKDFST